MPVDIESLNSNGLPTRLLKFDDGFVTIFLQPRINHKNMPMIIAEELEADWSKVQT
jgi:hypothetical protein